MIGVGKDIVMDADYNELRVVEVLVDQDGAVTALRVEVVWGTARGADEPLVWDRSMITVGAVGAMAGLAVGDRLELRPRSGDAG